MHAYVCVCVYTLYISVYIYICIYIYTHTPHLYPFICRWAFRLLPRLAVINSASVNTGIHVSTPSSQCLSSNQFLHSLVFFWPVSIKDNLQALPLFLYWASMSPSTSNPSSPLATFLRLSLLTSSKGLFMDQSRSVLSIHWKD